MLEKFAVVDLGVDEAALSPSDREVLHRAVEAARHMDKIFWTQAWSGNEALRERLSGRQREEFELMYGPYDRLEDHRPFIEGVPRRPDGAAFYPDDLTREEFEAYVAAHPDEKAELESLTTLVRRLGHSLVAVPYSDAYRPELEAAASDLRAAADATHNPSLEKFLRSRAEALLSDDYYQSDLDWMDVEGNVIDVTIGPYETYEDLLFGYKASYEAYVGVVDARESANLQTYAQYLDEMDALLASRVPFQIHRGGSSPIRVVNLAYNAGDARAGVQTTAFNLPNDERVHEAKGTRKVMLRNVAQAKFERSMMPIARALLSAADVEQVTFDAYFTNVLLHEMAHSLGPSYRADGETVRRTLRDLYSPIEEAKADIVGLFFHQWLIDRGVRPAEEERRAYTSFLAGFFRSVRFGMTEAHGKANVAELNFLQEQGAVTCVGGRYQIDLARAREAVAALVDRLIALEATGSYEDAAAFLERYGRPDAQLLDALQRLGDVPVDILPRFTMDKAAV